MSQAKLKAKIEAEANRPIAESLDGGYVGSSGREAEDAADLAEIEAVLAKNEPKIPWEDVKAELEAAMEPVAAAVPVSLHALDTSPVNSKIVVTDEGAILATPEFEIRLPDGDPAHKLPVGARIQKKAEGIYLSLQMSPAVDHPILVTATASDAIAKFVPHFHESD